MVNGGIVGQPVAQACIPLQRGESLQSRLALRAGNKRGRSTKKGCLVLTDQRLIHIPDGVTDAEVQSVPLRDVGTAEVTKQRRHNELLLLAGYALIGGVAYAASLFSNTAAVTIFFLALAALIWWWFPARDTVVRVKMAETQIEVVVGRGGRREASEFLNDLMEVKEKEA